MITDCDTTFEFIERYYLTDIPIIMYKLVPDLMKDEEKFEDCRSYICKALLQQRRVEKFDATKGAKLSTYLYQSITHLLFTSLKESKRNKFNREFDSLDRNIYGNLAILGDFLIDKKAVVSDTALTLSQILPILEEHDLYSSFNRKLHASDLLKLYIKEYTDTEISKLFNISVSAVRTCKKNLIKKVGEIDSGEIFCKMEKDKARMQL